MAKYFSFHGSCRPFARRWLASGESAALVMYSTQADISCTVPLPRLPQRYGSQPTCSQRSKNSCVPNWLVSCTPPQVVLIIGTRLSRGPTPSVQWYSSAKHPPGQRSTGTCKVRSAATTSLRMPRVLGMGESSPTHNPS